MPSDVTVTVPAKDPWTNTGVLVEKGKKILIAYQSGTWTCNPESSPGYDADGLAGYPAKPDYVLPGKNEGGLVGKVGERTFWIGLAGVVPEGDSGKLFLGINEDALQEYGRGYDDNQGELTVVIVSDVADPVAWVTRLSAPVVSQIGLGAAYHPGSAVTLPGLPGDVEAPASGTGGSWQDDGKIISAEEQREFDRDYPNYEAQRDYSGLQPQTGEPYLRRSTMLLLALAHAYHDAEQDDQLLLVGHPDRDDGERGETVAQARLDNLLSLLNGDDQLWAKTCQASPAPIRDLQRILLYYSDVHHWPCAPPAVDDQWSVELERALTSFRDTYKQIFAESFDVDRARLDPVFAAVFRLYRREIADWLKVAPGDLKPYQDAVVFVQNDAPVAQGGTAVAPSSGELWARVEILFAPPSETQTVRDPAGVYQTRDLIALMPETWPLSALISYVHRGELDVPADDSAAEDGQPRLEYEGRPFEGEFVLEDSERKQSWIPRGDHPDADAASSSGPLQEA